jgi:hypothetical protein
MPIGVTVRLLVFTMQCAYHGNGITIHTSPHESVTQALDYLVASSRSESNVDRSSYSPEELLPSM